LTGRWLAAALVLAPAGAAAQDQPLKELCRFRITNRAGAPVEVSSDGGAAWQPLGKVTRSATGVAIANSSISVAPAGAVAGVTPDQLLIRLPADKERERSLRILSKNEATVNASGAAIATDISSRGPLFCCLAPPTGSPVLLEQGDGVKPLTAAYVPRPGDRLLIFVTAPAAGDPPSLTIENREGGEVTLLVPGSAARPIARVKQALKGTGRYAGTERAGSGYVLSWSPTAVLVSTSGRSRRLDENGQPREERGGFVIQPAEPALRGATHPASQLLLEALPEGETRPPVSPLFGLPVPVSSGDPLDPLPTRIEVRIDEGVWESFPDLRGTIGEEQMVKALEEALGQGRTVKTGITHLRIAFGSTTDASFRRRLRLATTPAAPQPQRGLATITANVMGDGVTLISFFLNGVQAKLTNVPPYAWEWDTLKVPNGEHLIEIRGFDDKGVLVSTVMTRVLVDN
jgi:hypothetical protein